MEKFLKVIVKHTGNVASETAADRLKEPKPDPQNNHKIEFEGTLIEIVTCTHHRAAYVRGIVIKEDGSLVECCMDEITVAMTDNPLIQD